MGREHNNYIAEVLYQPGEQLDLAPLADALLLLHTDAALDRALRLAQDLNATAYQQQVRNQALTAAADDLRARLALIEEQLRRVA